MYPNIHAMAPLEQTKAKQWGGDLFSKYFEDDLKRKQDLLPQQQQQQETSSNEKENTPKTNLKAA